MRDYLREHKPNVVVDLRPEGYQLIKLKEEIFEYLAEGARQHLITAFWEYLLLLEVAHKLLEKDQKAWRFNHEIRDLYLRLEAIYKAEDLASGGDFSERLLALANRLSRSFNAKFEKTSGLRLTAESVSELVYSHDIRALREQIVEYLARKPGVWILFDNLDKGWNTQGIDAIDALVFRCLVDAGRKLEREMRRAGHALHCVVFVRNDVYENLMRTSPDYGKEMRAVLDWTDPDMLREVLRLRLVSGLGNEYQDTPFASLWPKICVSHHQGEDTSSYMIDRSLMRPRNLLKILAHSMGFANNFRKSLITSEDIDKGLLAYSHDLLIELDRELSDVMPAAKDVLYHLIGAPAVMDAPELEARLTAGGVGDADIKVLVEFLLYYGVVGLHTSEADLYIYDVNYDAKILRVRVQHAGRAARFAVNPAFWPALGILPAA